MRKRTCNVEALKDFVESRGLSLRPNRRSYILRCTLCEKPKLFVERATGLSVCFHCGDDMKGWADFVLSRVTGIGISELSDLFYGDKAPAGTNVIDIELTDWYREAEGDEEEIELEEELPELVWSPDYRPLARDTEGERYLTRRGIPFEVARAYGIRFSGRDCRVAFPAVIDSTLRGWQARYTRETDIVNPETGEKFIIPKMLTVGKLGGKCLMFQDRVKGSHAVLCEGPIDAIKCHLAGGNTAAMGKGFTRVQLRILARKGVRKLYCALDPDAAADIERLVSESQEFDFKLYRMEPPRGSGAEDMGDLSFEAAYDVFRNASEMHVGQVFYFFERTF